MSYTRCRKRVVATPSSSSSSNGDWVTTCGFTNLRLDEKGKQLQQKRSQTNRVPTMEPTSDSSLHTYANLCKSCKLCPTPRCAKCAKRATLCKNRRKIIFAFSTQKQQSAKVKASSCRASYIIAKKQNHIVSLRQAFPSQAGGYTIFFRQPCRGCYLSFTERVGGGGVCKSVPPIMQWNILQNKAMQGYAK